MNIKIKGWFGDWQYATREQARRFWLTWSRGAQGLKEEEKPPYLSKSTCAVLRWRN